MKASAARLAFAVVIVALGIFIGNLGLFVGQNDDAPPLGLLGILTIVTSIAVAAKVAWKPSPAEVAAAGGVAFMGATLFLFAALDDAPGGSLLGLLMIVGAAVYSVRAMRRRGQLTA